MTPEKSAAQGEKVVRISYHRRMYGLGEVCLSDSDMGSALMCSITIV